MVSFLLTGEKALKPGLLQHMLWGNTQQLQQNTHTNPLEKQKGLEILKLTLLGIHYLRHFQHQLALVAHLEEDHASLELS